MPKRTYDYGKGIITESWLDNQPPEKEVYTTVTITKKDSDIVRPHSSESWKEKIDNCVTGITKDIFGNEIQADGNADEHEFYYTTISGKYDLNTEVNWIEIEDFNDTTECDKILVDEEKMIKYKLTEKTVYVLESQEDGTTTEYNSLDEIEALGLKSK